MTDLVERIEELEREVSLWKACTETALNQRDSAEVRAEKDMIDDMRAWCGGRNGVPDAQALETVQAFIDAYERDRLK